MRGRKFLSCVILVALLWSIFVSIVPNNVWALSTPQSVKPENRDADIPVIPNDWAGAPASRPADIGPVWNTNVKGMAYYQYVGWWENTCQHKGHDEWRVVAVNPDGTIASKDSGSMYVLHEYSGAYNPADYHKWAYNVPYNWYYDGTAAITGGTVNKYYRKCVMQAGYWGNQEQCSAKDYNYGPLSKINAPTQVYVGQSFTVSSASTDSDGSIASYEWSTPAAAGSISGSSGTFTYNSVGTYTISLKVTDNEYGEGNASVAVNVVDKASPVLTISSKDITPKITTFASEAVVTDVNEIITVTAALNDCTSLSNIDKWEFFVSKDGGTQEVITFSGTAAQSLSRTAMFSNMASHKILAADILAQKTVNAFYDVNVRVTFKTPVAGSLTAEPSRHEGLSAIVSVDAVPAFSIIQASKDVTDQGITVNGAPYQVTLQDASSGNIVSRDWYYTNSSGTTTLIASGNQTSVAYSVPSLGNAVFTLKINGSDTKKVSHTLNASTAAPVTPPSPPAPVGAAPSANILAPAAVLAGTPFSVVVSGNDSDGKITNLWLAIDNSPTQSYIAPVPVLNVSHSFTLKASQTGLLSMVGTATDNSGLNSSALASVKVVDPVPVPDIKVTGNLKANRKVTLDSSSSIPNSGDYPVDSSKNVWKIEPMFTLASGKTVADYIKITGVAGASYVGNALQVTGNKIYSVLFKDEGSYKVTLHVQNYFTPQSKWLTAATEKVISIADDIAPVAGLDCPDLNYRQIENSNNASFYIYNTSYSIDGDKPGYLKVSYLYDANNNGTFGDNGEVYKLLYESSDTAAIMTLGSLTLNLPDVGKYKLRIDIKDSIPDSETVPAFITASDYLGDYFEKIMEVDNMAPATTVDAVKKRKAEVEFIYDKSSGLNAADVQNLINSELLPDFNNQGISLISNIKNANVFSDPVVTKPSPLPTVQFAGRNNTVAPPYDIFLDNTRVPGRTSLRIVDTRDGTYNYVTGNFSITWSGASPRVFTFSQSHFYIYVYVGGNLYAVDVATGNVVWSRVVQPDVNSKIQFYHSNRLTTIMEDWANNTYYEAYAPWHDMLDSDCFLMTTDNKADGVIVSHTFTKIDPFTGQNVYSITPADVRPGYLFSLADMYADINKLYNFSQDVHIVTTENYTPNVTGQNGIFTINIYNLKDGSLHGSKAYTYPNYWVKYMQSTSTIISEKRLLHKVSFDTTGNITYLVQTNFGESIWAGIYCGYGLESRMIKLDINGNSTFTMELAPIAGYINEPAAGWYSYNIHASGNGPIAYSLIYAGGNHTVISSRNGLFYINTQSRYISAGFGTLSWSSMIIEYPDELYIISYDYSDNGISTDSYGYSYQYYQHYVDVKQCNASGVTVVNSGDYEEEAYEGDPPYSYTMLGNDHGITPMYVSTPWPDIDYGILRIINRTQGMMVKPDWNTDTEHYVVYLSKNSTNPGVVSSRNLSILLNENASLIEMVAPAAQTEALQHIALNDNNGRYIDNSNYNTAFAAFSDYITKDTAPPYVKTKFATVGDEFSFTANYYDSENDPKSADKWNISHDPTKVNGVAINNQTPAIPQAGQDLSAPLDTFTAPGTYTIKYSAKDSTGNSIYDKWSDPANSTIIYNVHRKPIPQFKVSMTPSGTNYIVDVTDSNLSYDPDHSSRTDKGITAREWKWKEESETTWHTGRMTGTFPANKKYLVYLRVQDYDNSTWSDPKIETFTTVVTNLSPVAQFTVNPVLLPTTSSLIVTDNSYAMGLDSISIREWAVFKDGGTTPIYTGSTCKTNYADTGVGNYDIYLRAKSTNGLWSGDNNYSTWYKQSITVYINDTTAPTLSINPLNGGWTNKDISVGLIANDTGGSGYRETRYVISASAAAPSEAGLTSSTGDKNASIALPDTGTWYIHAQSYDGKGNKSGIKTGGPYRIDKVLPSGTGTLNTTAWTNQNVTIAFNASDSGGSGVKRIQKPDGSWVAAASTTYVVTGNGTYSFMVEDNAGNITSAPIQVKITNIDKSVPAGLFNPNESAWTNADIPAAFEVTSTGISGLNYWRYRTSSNNGSTWGAWSSNIYSLTGSIKLNTQATWKLQAEIYNKAGSSAAITSGSYYIDKTLPSGVFTPNSAAWTNQNVLITFDPSDAGGSGVKQWKYRTSANNGSSWGVWSSYTAGDTNGAINLTSQGVWLIQAEVADNAGNIKALESGAYNIDKTPPAAAADIASRSWSNANVSVNLTYTDAGGSGIKDKQYAWSTGTATPTSWASYTATVTQTAQRVWYLHYRTTDKAGNVKTGYFGPYRIDKTAPGGTFIPPNLPWTNSNVTVTFDPSDAGGSGVKQWRYRASSNNGSTWGAWSSYTTGDVSGGINLTSQGIWLLQAEITDNAGNAATITSGSYNIDKTPPQVAASPASQSWTNKDISVNLTYTDAGGSNVAVKQYAWKNDVSAPSLWNSYTGTVTQTGQGVWYLHYRVVDNANNSAQGYFGSYAIDKTAPSGAGILSPTGWTNQNVTITFNASDSGGSGVKSITKPDNSIVAAASTTYAASVNGTYNFTVTDNAGNTAVVPVTVNNIDKINPSGTYTLSTSVWTNQNVTITFNASDSGGSGVKSITKPDNSIVAAASTIYVVSENGTYNFTVADNAGNTAVAPVIVSNIDKILPSGVFTPNSAVWTNQNVSVTFDPSDAGGSEVKQWRYRTSANNGSSWGAWSSYTAGDTNGSINLTSQGIWLIQAEVADNAGNISTVQSEIYSIDKTLPSGIFTPNSAAWTNQNVLVTFDPSDMGGSGVKKWRYRTSNNNGSSWGAWSSYAAGDVNGTINLTSQGVWLIQAEVTDNAGNIAVLQSGTYSIDRTLPSGIFTPNSAAWTNQNISVIFDPSDAGGSGVKKWRYRTSNNNGSSWGAWSSYTAGDTNGPINLTSQGIWLIQAEVTDNAGNINTVTSSNYCIDKTLPGGSFSPDGCIWVNSPRSTTFYPSDVGGSGVKQWRYRISSNNGSSWGEWSSYITDGISQSMNFATAGIWLVQVEIADNAGNINAINSNTFEIDITPPTGAFIPGAASWTNQNVSVTFDPSDEGGSGVKQWRYRISSDNGSNWGAWSYPHIVGDVADTFNFTDEGAWVIEAEVTDNAENTAHIVSGSYKIDITIPVIEALPAMKKTVDTSMTVLLNASDTGGSGLKLIRYVWSQSKDRPEAGWILAEGSDIVAELNNEGTYFLHVEACDNAGNWAVKVFGEYTLVFPVVDIYFQAYGRDTGEGTGLAAGELMRISNSNDALKGVLVVSNITIEKVNVYMNESLIGKLSLEDPIIKGDEYTYNAALFDYPVPAVTLDGIYDIVLEALTSVGTGKRVQAAIVINTPVNLTIEIYNPQENAAYTPITSVNTEGGIYNSVLTRGYNNIFKASASKYVDEVQLKLFDQNGASISDMNISYMESEGIWLSSADMQEALFDKVSNGRLEITALTANGNKQTENMSFYLRKPGVYELRLNGIADPVWRNCFESVDGQPSQLQVEGISIKDMPIYTNIEGKGIKLGYKTWSEVDTICLNGDDDYITIDAAFYALDRDNVLHEADVYVEDKQGEYQLLENSEYADVTKHILLYDDKRSASEEHPEINACSTWRFDYFIPPMVKAVRKGEKPDLFNINTFDYKLLVTLELKGVTSDGRIYTLTDSDAVWGSGTGEAYGKNRPTGLELLGKGLNYGEMLWYNLYETILDDYYIERSW